MPVYDLDYSALEKLNHKTHKYSDVKHLLKKVARNVVKFTDDPTDELWEIQSADDGDFIVAKYDTTDAETPIKQASLKSPWEAVCKGSSEIHLFYKGVAITKFAHLDAETIAPILPKKLATDSHFVEALFASLPKDRQTEIQKLYPELF